MKTNLKHIFISMLAFVGAHICACAQDVQLNVVAVTASQSQSGNPATNMTDGNTSTFWHSPWSGGTTSFPINLTFKIEEPEHLDYINYMPRQDGNVNGNFKKIIVMVGNGATSTTSADSKFVAVDTLDLGGNSSASVIELGENGIDDVQYVRIKVLGGQNNFAACSEMQFYRRDHSKKDAFDGYFTDALCTQLRPEITSADGIEDADVKALVSALLADPTGYSKFRVGQYRAYRPTASLQSELRTSSQYCRYENPTGIYAVQGTPMLVVVQGIGDNPVKLTVKNWVENETSSSYPLRNGLNFITPTSTGNTFINYYTEDYAVAPQVQVHFINGQVQGYWDQQTMTNEDWKEIMKLHPSTSDNSIIICRSQHAQTAYPAYIYRQNCPVNIDSLMTLYEQVQWAERDMMGLERYGRQTDNRQLFYGTTYGFMAAGGEGAYCNVTSLGALTKPDAASFDFWGVGHEWGHNNQIHPGFKWSGCGETTNNIYASWAQIHFTGNPDNLRLEDEVTGVNDYSGMRGGRMQTYFEEGLRKGIQWQLQDGPDYHGSTPSGTNNSRNYDHFVKLVPFWQLNLWGTLAGKCPYIIPMAIEGLRQTPSSTLSAMDNGKMQVNWMKLACDSAQINLLPFFERAGMLRPINAYIEDYGAGWNIITTAMIDNLKTYVEQKGYPEPTEEVNYINGHNWTIYRDRLPLEVPATLGEGCTLNGSTVKVLHSKVQNAVAYETYDSEDRLVRITMYGLGADSKHTYTQVLYPGAEDASYIMAVGYNGERKKIYEYTVPQLKKGRFYTLKSNGKGGYLTTDNCSVTKDGTITWNISRASTLDTKKAGNIWYAQERDGKMYLYNPQAKCYVGGSNNTQMSQFILAEKDAPYFTANLVSESASTWILAMNGGSQFLNSYSNTNTGFWSGGSGDPNNIWVVKEATSIDVSVPGIGYRAIYYPFGLEIPAGFTAYLPTEIVNIGGVDYLLMHEAEKELQSYEPAILYKGESATATMTLVDDYSAESPTHTNLLTGALLKTTGYKSGDLMGLNKTEGERVGFVSSTSTSMTANTAYLLSEKAVSASLILLADDDPLITGLENIDALTQDLEVLYDLSGRVASRGSRVAGQVYITRNGRKVIWK